jgi:hypothetical protein
VIFRSQRTVTWSGDARLDGSALPYRAFRGSASGGSTSELGSARGEHMQLCHNEEDQPPVVKTAFVERGMSAAAES